MRPIRTRHEPDALRGTTGSRAGRPAAPPTRPCRRCGHPTRADRAVQGYGRDCAEQLGLTGGTVDVEQDGPDLFDVLEDEIGPDDECDGWDRPADRP